MDALTIPPVRFFTRCSDLSLCGMHPSPVPDAEAHGKDGDKRPEQLYFPDGEALVSYPLLSTCLFIVATPTANRPCTSVYKTLWTFYGTF